MKVQIFGAGKVGRALYRGGKRAGCQVTLRRARSGAPKRKSRADLWILAVRDSTLIYWAKRLAASGCLRPGAAVVHVAGAVGSEVLEPLQAADASLSLGQMHPLLSFATHQRPPKLRGGSVLLSGDPPAIRRARAFAKHLGLVPRIWPDIDRSLYHAAAVVLASGTVSLTQLASDLLGRAGVPAEERAEALSALLQSVVVNLENLGLPGALTGPIRRGDLRTVRAHLRQVDHFSAAERGLYRGSAMLQLKMAKELSEASQADLDAIAVLLRSKRDFKD